MPLIPPWLLEPLWEQFSALLPARSRTPLTRWAATRETAQAAIFRAWDQALIVISPLSGSLRLGSEAVGGVAGAAALLRSGAYDPGYFAAVSAFFAMAVAAVLAVRDIREGRGAARGQGAFPAGASPLKSSTAGGWAG